MFQSNLQAEAAPVYYEDTHSVIDDIKVCNFQRTGRSQGRLPLLFVKLQLQLRP